MHVPERIVDQSMRALILGLLDPEEAVEAQLAFQLLVLDFIVISIGVVFNSTDRTLVAHI
jgi:hypothetical protein